MKILESQVYSVQAKSQVNFPGIEFQQAREFSIQGTAYNLFL